MRPKPEGPEAIAEAPLPTPERIATATQPVHFHKPERTQPPSVGKQADPPRSQIRKAEAAITEAVLVPRLPQQEGMQLARSLATKAESPVIHVTIGRVEIRAVAVAAQSKRAPAQSKPALSLNDYLQRRNKVPG